MARKERQVIEGKVLFIGPYMLHLVKLHVLNDLALRMRIS